MSEEQLPPVSSDRRSSDIDAIVKAEAGSSTILVMRARTMFVHERTRDNTAAATDWAIIGIALATVCPDDIEGKD